MQSNTRIGEGAADGGAATATAPAPDPLGVRDLLERLDSKLGAIVSSPGAGGPEAVGGPRADAGTLDGGGVRAARVVLLTALLPSSLLAREDWDAAVAVRAAIRSRRSNRLRSLPSPEQRVIFVANDLAPLSSAALSSA